MSSGLAGAPDEGVLEAVGAARRGTAAAADFDDPQSGSARPSKPSLSKGQAEPILRWDLRRLDEWLDRIGGSVGTDTDDEWLDRFRRRVPEGWPTRTARPLPS